MNMYLVRTIQECERPAWVAQLGTKLKCAIPLPVVPRRRFRQIIVIHAGQAREFDVASTTPCVPPRDVPVGFRPGVVIRARILVYVKKGPRRIGRALTRGFQGIRYTNRWSSVARTTRGGATFVPRSRPAGVEPDGRSPSAPARGLTPSR